VAMRCSPSAVFKLIYVMSECYKKRLTDLGFGEFLKFKIDSFEERCLGMFLMKNVKVKPLRIQFGGKVLPITAAVVHKVFGLPIGGRRFPKFKRSETTIAKSELRRLCDEKDMEAIYETCGRPGANYQNLQRFAVPRWVLENFARTNKDDFDDWAVRCFFMIVCNALLFATSDYHITGANYLMCKDLEALAGYDWCRAVVDDIETQAVKWQKKYAPNRIPCILGCTVLLMVRNHFNFHVSFFSHSFLIVLLLTSSILCRF
jgi:hypothetical protein